MSDEILVEKEGKILQLTMNRPNQKNAINLAMYESLTEHMKQAANDGTRVIVLSGAGGCFTSGNDLGDFANNANVVSNDNPIARFLYTVLELPIPLVVAVEGVAVGIGTTVLLHSDLVYAHSNAQFSLPFVNLGLCPEFASSYVLPALAGRVKAAEWLLLGEFFSAADAKDANLINDITDNPLETALSQARKLAAQPPAAMRNAKALIAAPHKDNIAKVMENEFDIFNRSLKGAEFSEAAKAFFEKRRPDFSKF
ncbi:enoyl-CoA hydratase-related protein [Agarilytica rhodophyticola]|uniref:enoyl-CoA hydratase-related protein n=1 Tax=Agarilytica rhodophyticola TaxID=1737490 RepID=UPI000B347A83|nr:enoyl-CoA hydratase-related protein [Agarilytica rhodophyticola]